MGMDKQRGDVMSQHPIPSASGEPLCMNPWLSSDATVYYAAVSFSTVTCDMHDPVKLTPPLPLFLLRSLGGAAVTVHPGLQGDVQAFTRGATEE